MLQGKLIGNHQRDAALIYTDQQVHHGDNIHYAFSTMNEHYIQNDPIYSLIPQ